MVLTLLTIRPVEKRTITWSKFYKIMEDQTRVNWVCQIWEYLNNERPSHWHTEDIHLEGRWEQLPIRKEVGCLVGLYSSSIIFHLFIPWVDMACAIDHGSFLEIIYKIKRKSPLISKSDTEITSKYFEKNHSDKDMDIWKARPHMQNVFPCLAPIRGSLKVLGKVWTIWN